MMKKNIFAFTLVELIVVITIVSILSTVGFVAYTDYLTGVRDSSRLQQTSGIYNAIELYSTREKIPLSGDIVSLTYNSSMIGYQGDFDQSVFDKIQYSDGGRDPKTKDFFSYRMDPARKNIQILTFLEEEDISGNTTSTYKTHAVAEEYTGYDVLYPYVRGIELGVLLEEDSNIPVHKITSEIVDSNFNIATATGNYIALINNIEKISSVNQSLLSIVPKISCKNLYELGNITESGIYKINLNGVEFQDVYCDMELDGGGWTLIARSVVGFDELNFGWKIAQGNIFNNTIPYSMGASIQYVNFDEILFTTYTEGKNIASASKFKPGNSIFFPSNINSSADSIGNISNCQTLMVDVQDICGRSTEISGPVQYWGMFNKSNMYYLFHRNQDSNTGLSASTYVGQNVFGEDFQNEPGMIFVR